MRVALHFLVGNRMAKLGVCAGDDLSSKLWPNTNPYEIKSRRISVYVEKVCTSKYQ